MFHVICFMIILGIDPGTATTGWGVVEKQGKNLECLAYGAIITKAGQQNSHRLQQIYKEVIGLIKKYEPDTLMVEKLFFFKNLKTAMPVAEARGVILLAAADKKITLKELTPLQVKMAICGYGRADKKQIQKMVQQTLKLEKMPKPDDAADGLALAICGCLSGFARS